MGNDTHTHSASYQKILCTYPACESAAPPEPHHSSGRIASLFPSHETLAIDGRTIEVPPGHRRHRGFFRHARFPNDSGLA